MIASASFYRQNYLDPLDPPFQNEKTPDLAPLSPRLQSNLELFYQIQQDPEFINRSLSTGRVPIEEAMAYRNYDHIQILSHHHANINLEGNFDLTPLENAFLIQDQKVLQSILGRTLAQIFSSEFDRLKELSSYELDSVMQMLQAQKNEILRTIKSCQEFEPLKTHAPIPMKGSIKSDHFYNTKLIQAIQSHNLTQLKSALDFPDTDYTSSDFIDAIAVAILSHNNEALKFLYELKGPFDNSSAIFDDNALSKATYMEQDKSLFHLAAIANNAEALYYLHSKGLASSTDCTHPYSPFHYASVQPDLNCFFALIEIGEPMPPPSHGSINPIEQLALGAIAKNSLQDMSLLDKIYIFSETAALALPFASKYLNHTTQSVAHFSMMLIRCLALQQPSSHTSYQEKKINSLAARLRSAASLALPILMYAQDNRSKIFSEKALNHLQPLIRATQAVSCLAVLQKIGDDCKAYRSAFSFRPYETLWAMGRDGLRNAFYIKNLFFDFPQLMTTTTKVAPPPHSPPPMETARLGALSEQVKKTSLVKLQECITSLNKYEYLHCVLGQWHTEDEVRRTFKQIFKKVHPDRCSAKEKKNCIEIFHGLQKFNKKS